MAQKPATDKNWANMKIHLREAQDDLNSLPISGSMFHNPQQSNFTPVTDVVTQSLIQEQAILAN